MSGDKILIRPGHTVGLFQPLVQFNAYLLNEFIYSYFLQNEIKLESVQVTSDSSIEYITPIKRGCLFNHEQPENYTLKAHKKYTQVK